MQRFSARSLSIAALLAAVLFVALPVGVAAALPAPVAPGAAYPPPLPAGCPGGAAALVDEQFTVNGSAAQPVLTGFAVTAGDVVTMTWADFADGCKSTGGTPLVGVSLAVKKSDGPTFQIDVNQELVQPFDYCGPDPGGAACTQAGGRYSLSVVVPPREIACFYQVDAALGAPLAIVGPNGSYYSPASRGDGGADLLISAANGASDSCQGLPAVAASASVLCADKVVRVNLATNSSSGATFSLSANGAVVDGAVVVGGNSVAFRDVPISSSVTLTVTAGGQAVTVLDHTTGEARSTYQLPVNCGGTNLPVSATARVLCGRGVEVTITNSRTTAVDVTIAVGGTDEATVNVPAGGNAATVVAAGRTGQVTITARTGADQVTVTPSTLDVNQLCQNLSAVAASCTGSGVNVLVSAPLEQSTTVVVRADGVVVLDAVLAANEARIVSIPANGRTAIQVTVVLGGRTELDRQVPANCQATFACVTSGIRVSYTNPLSDVPGGRFQVTSGGQLLNEQTIAPGATVTFTVPLADQAAYSITATVNGFDRTQTGTHNCRPTASQACSSDGSGAPIVVRNPGDAPVGLRVTVGGSVVSPSTVAAGGQVTIPVGLNAQGSSLAATVEADGVTILGPSSVLRCTNPQLPITGFTTRTRALAGMGATLAAMGLVVSLLGLALRRRSWTLR